MIHLIFDYFHKGGPLGAVLMGNTDEPGTPDPAKGNLTEFRVLMGDTILA